MKKLNRLESEVQGWPTWSMLEDEGLPRYDYFGSLLAKDKQAREEIKELKIEVERLNRLLITMGRSLTNAPVDRSDLQELDAFLYG